MILGIAEDFTSEVTLDSQLTAVPDSGLYYNSGVHPSVTVDNLLHFLPNITFTFADWLVGTTYGEFDTSRSKNDIVLDGGIIYQSLVAGNTGNTPASSPTEWLVTNIESIRLKTFIKTVEDKVISDLHLSRRLVDSQYLYNLVEQNRNISPQLLPNDYAAWVFEPKGSDYVTFRINQAALQATTATPQNLYVINQGELVTTLTLNPNAEGRLVFEDLAYTFSGKGIWMFAIDSQNVLTDGGYIDPLQFDGFVSYTASGIGASPEDAIYSFGTSGNGLSFNITAYLDSSTYLNNNLVEFAQFLQATFELETLNIFLNNSNNRSNHQQRIQLDTELLIAETKEINANTVVKRYRDEKERSVLQLAKTFDRELNDNDDSIVIQTTST